MCLFSLSLWACQQSLVVQRWVTPTLGLTKSYLHSSTQTLLRVVCYHHTQGEQKQQHSRIYSRTHDTHNMIFLKCVCSCTYKEADPLWSLMSKRHVCIEDDWPLIFSCCHYTGAGQNNLSSLFSSIENICNFFKLYFYTRVLIPLGKFQQTLWTAFLQMLMHCHFYFMN